LESGNDPVEAVTRLVRSLEAWCIAESWFSLALARVQVRFLPKRVIRELMLPGGEVGPSEGQADLDRLLALFKLVAAEHALRVSCLPRAIALRRMLARRGLAARVNIGFSLASSPPLGHAWVELDGVPVLEDPDIERWYGFRVSQGGLERCSITGGHLQFH
jgi:Transglutaminase-like superfamily